MHLDSARALKQEIRSNVLQELLTTEAASRMGISARRATAPPITRSIAIGIASSTESDYKLAVRVQRSELSHAEVLESIRSRASGEVDVRYIGRVVKFDTGRHRPLSIGCSVGHPAITAGTLGCFVRSRSGVGGVMILSNNHVLADENRTTIGDFIVQPGELDGGLLPTDAVARLTNFEPLIPGRTNTIDAAVAELLRDIDFVASTIPGVGLLNGVGSGLPAEDDIVHKRGRTTSATTGRVTAFEVDNVVVDYEIGNVRFDNQIEVEGVAQPFSRGGDSGSIVVNDRGEAIGLLYAGSDTGGTNDLGLTYLNPIADVLDGLNIEVVTAP